MRYPRRERLSNTAIPTAGHDWWDKVGILGISYDGFLALAPLVNPHPALKVAVPENPMVDGWRGDDWFYNGAFRQQNLPYIYEQTATRSNDELWESG
jgi:predicted acyl esterase